MDTLELFLKNDINKIKRPSGKMEINRLSKAFGSAVIFEYEALTLDELEDVRQSAIKDDKFEASLMWTFTILKSVKNPNLKSQELRDKLGVPTPVDVVKKILLSGEIQQLYNSINEISGFGEGSVTEIKN